MANGVSEKSPHAV